MPLLTKLGKLSGLEEVSKGLSWESVQKTFSEQIDKLLSEKIDQMTSSEETPTDHITKDKVPEITKTVFDNDLAMGKLPSEADLAARFR